MCFHVLYYLFCGGKTRKNEVSREIKIFVSVISISEEEVQKGRDGLRGHTEPYRDMSRIETNLRL